jgi:hypothetical protein
MASPNTAARNQRVVIIGRRLRRFVGCKKAGKEPLPDHPDRPAQLPLVSTFALSASCTNP